MSSSTRSGRAHSKSIVVREGWSFVCVVLGEEEILASSIDDLRELLEGGAAAIDRLLARWLVALAEFDRSQGWVVDGCLSMIDWLTTRAGLSRSTAFEKLRVAAELRRRPIIREALLQGRISYSAARAITRAKGASEGVDRSLVDVAVHCTVSDVEQVVRHYLRYKRQDDPLPERLDGARGVRVRQRGDGLSHVTAVVTDVEAAELAARLDAAPVGGECALSAPSRPARRADALLALVRGGDGLPRPSADRHMVHHVVDHTTGAASLLDGTPVDDATAAAVCCDATNVTHLVDPVTAEPMRLGRAARTWSAAQRRAVTVRDGGRCRWPGCAMATTDVHHVLSWSDGGSTDVDNGALVCPRHHTLTHRGWFTTGTASGELTWHHPGSGLPIGGTRPMRPLVRELLAR